MWLFRPSEHCLFFSDDWFEVSHVYVYSEKWTFSLIYLLRSVKSGGRILSEFSVRFSKTISLRGHMPRFTLKLTVFKCSSSLTTLKSEELEPLSSLLVFPRRSIWEVICVRFTLKMNISSIYLLRNPIVDCVKTLRTVLIFPRLINLKSDMPRFTLKMNALPVYQPGGYMP